jgi:hypothetical protein
MATKGPAKVVDPKSIADPVARARALRAARQSNPVSAGLAKSTAPALRPGSASPKMMHNPRSPVTAGPIDRTGGARKRHDHLAPKKTGVDQRLAAFTTASRTVKRRPSDGHMGASPDPHDPEESGDAAQSSPRPTRTSTACEPASAALRAASEAAGEEDPAEAEEQALARTVRGDDENWLDAIQRKEEEERQRKEEEAREAKRQQEKSERDAKEQEAQRRRKESVDARRAELEDARRRKQAERREQGDKDLEDRARTRDAELARILQENSQSAGDAVARVAEERNARKARIAELVSKVKGVSIADSDDDPAALGSGPDRD